MEKKFGDKITYLSHSAPEYIMTTHSHDYPHATTPHHLHYDTCVNCLTDLVETALSTSTSLVIRWQYSNRGELFPGQCLILNKKCQMCLTTQLNEPIFAFLSCVLVTMNMNMVLSHIV